MRAEIVIATHGNTDFDAFAALLAARRLYPDAVACVAGSLNRNVREFSRLHADELGLVDASRLELDAIRRLIVVETTHAPALASWSRSRSTATSRRSSSTTTPASRPPGRRPSTRSSRRTARSRRRW